MHQSLRRLKAHGACTDDLVDVYTKQVRCVLELAVAAWSPGITSGQVAQIERVQKAAFAVILGDDYIDYRNALAMLGLQTLSERRKALCLKFGKKCLKSEQYKHWFVERPDQVQQTQTRSIKTSLLPVHTRTKRYSKSAIPYLTTLLNEAGVQKLG